MTVLLPDRLLGVRQQIPSVADSHGYRHTTGWGGMQGPWPGRAEEGPDVPIGQTGGRAWVLAVDPRAWPVLQGDLVVEVTNGADTAEWVVLSADLLHNNADVVVDYVRVEAHLRTTGTSP